MPTNLLPISINWLMFTMPLWMPHLPTRCNRLGRMYKLFSFLFPHDRHKKLPFLPTRFLPLNLLTNLHLQTVQPLTKSVLVQNKPLIDPPDINSVYIPVISARLPDKQSKLPNMCNRFSIHMHILFGLILPV